jgi:hypothetical protein
MTKTKPALAAVAKPDQGKNQEGFVAVMSYDASREIHEIQAIGWAIDCLSFTGQNADGQISDTDFIARLGCLGSAIAKKAGRIAEVMEFPRHD